MYCTCCIYCIYFRCRIYCSHSYSADKPISGGKEFQKLKVAGNSGASHFALCLLFLYMIEWIARRNCQFDHSHEFLAHAWKKSRSSWCFQILDSGGEVTLIKSRGHLYSSQDLRPWGQNAMHRYQVTVGDTCQLFAILKLFWKYLVAFFWVGWVFEDISLESSWWVFWDLSTQNNWCPEWDLWQLASPKVFYFGAEKK